MSDPQSTRHDDREWRYPEDQEITEDDDLPEDEEIRQDDK
jgi:hypothetical protein